MYEHKCQGNMTSAWFFFTARKRGRTRKSEQKPKPIKAEPETPVTPEKSKLSEYGCGEGCTCITGEQLCSAKEKRIQFTLCTVNS